MKHINTFLFNVALFVITYYAFVEHIDGAYNVLCFIITIIFLVGIYLASDEGKLMVSKSPPRTFLSKIYRTTDIILVFVFVWFGSWFLGVLMLLTVIFVEISSEGASKIRSAHEYLKAVNDQEASY
jgi:sterol desaturase/sphingolipid hydroxylase (fatty acid hydroxylase superfamily)